MVKVIWPHLCPLYTSCRGHARVPLPGRGGRAALRARDARRARGVQGAQVARGARDARGVRRGRGGRARSRGGGARGGPARARPRTGAARHCVRAHSHHAPRDASLHFSVEFHKIKFIKNKYKFYTCILR